MKYSAGAHGRFAFPALLLANLFMAFGPLLVRLSDVGPVAAAFWRTALAIPLLLILARWTGRGRLNPGWAVGGTILVAGLVFAADLGAWHYGIVRTKLANATLFGNSSTFLFAFYGFIMMRAMPRPMQLGALLLAVVGAGLLLGSSYEVSRVHLVGDLFALLGGFFYALYLIAVDRVRKSMPAMPLLAFTTLASAGPLLLLAWLLGERIMPGDWTPLLFLSLGSQVLGQGLLIYAMGYLTPLVVALGLLTQPAVSALLGWLVYGERLSAADIGGALLISAALVLIRLPERLAPGRVRPHLGTIGERDDPAQ